MPISGLLPLQFSLLWMLEASLYSKCLVADFFLSFRSVSSVAQSCMTLCPYPSSLSLIVTSSEAFSDPSILQVTISSILEMYSTILHSTYLYLILHHLFVVQSIIRSNSFVTPWTVAHQAPLSMGFLRQEYWSGLPFPSPRDLPDPGIELMSSALAVEFFISEPPGKPTSFVYLIVISPTVSSKRTRTLFELFTTASLRYVPKDCLIQVYHVYSMYVCTAYSMYAVPVYISFSMQNLSCMCAV